MRMSRRMGLYCTGSRKLTYYGTTTSLGEARAAAATANIGIYALFAGGSTGGTGSAAAVDAYNSSLIRSLSTALSVSRRNLAGVVVGSYALFGGGRNSSQPYSKDTVDTYNASLVKGTAAALSQARYLLAAAPVGAYALFGGGRYSGSSSSESYKSTVDAYNTSLTKSTPAALTNAAYFASAAAVGNYAIFACTKYGSSGDVPFADAYSSSLVKTVLSAPSDINYYPVGSAAIGNYALFAGGNSRSVVDVYNNSLVKCTPLTLTDGGGDGAAGVNTKDYALFGGGYNSTAANINSENKCVTNVTAFDKSLVRSIPQRLSVGRTHIAGECNGKYAIFAGGSDLNSSNPIAAVDVYQN